MSGSVFTWRERLGTARTFPPELRELPAGRYVVEAIEEEAPALTAEEEAGIEAALESYRQGSVTVRNPRAEKNRS